ncbi:hypothetical protein CEXT_235871 [Caerostris extrusa]|uniref:Uncharacterized protein n=1 Tax=Caerostris extrusa TaxID=172846 RepID=A0AAV4N4W0_CAEEX|nr:hypothetical protein CEXT_235871 [Caerostris extrusa]
MSRSILTLYLISSPVDTRYRSTAINRNSPTRSGDFLSSLYKVESGFVPVMCREDIFDSITQRPSDAITKEQTIWCFLLSSFYFMKAFGSMYLTRLMLGLIEDKQQYDNCDKRGSEAVTTDWTVAPQRLTHPHQ